MKKTRAEIRFQRERHIRRKEEIIRAYQHDSRPFYMDAMAMFGLHDIDQAHHSLGTGEWMPYWNVRNRGMLSKGKIHCSCPMCRAKTRNKGARRKGTYSRAINYTIADLRRKIAMDMDEQDYLFGIDMDDIGEPMFA